MENLSVNLLIGVLTIVFSGGAAWGGVKAGFNTMKRSIDNVEQRTKEINENLQNHENRITVIETVHRMDERNHN